MRQVWARPWKMEPFGHVRQKQYKQGKYPMKTGTGEWAELRTGFDKLGIISMCL